MYYNFTAEVGTDASKLVSLTGKLLAISAGVREVIFYGPAPSPTPTHLSTFAMLIDGPNPRPPPPPPPRCTDAYNATACAATPKQSGLGCTWCSSDDGVHQLCFAEKHTPATAWKCGA